MKLPHCIVLVSAFSISTAAQLFSPPEPHLTPTPQQAYLNLLSINVFALGPAGYEAGLSSGEESYRSIAASTNALDLFSMTLTNAGPAGKIYALFGMRQIAPSFFELHRRELWASDIEVEVMEGCISRKEKISVIVNQMTLGNYDKHFWTPPALALRLSLHPGE